VVRWRYYFIFALALSLAACGTATEEPSAMEPSASGSNAILDSLVFYASFDREIVGDVGGGDLKAGTRFDHETEKGEFVFEEGIAGDAFRILPDAGIHGGALEASDILPRRGRLYFPAKGNLAYTQTNFAGSVSFWLKTNPDTMLKTGFSDPIQITEKGATNGGLWIDFDNSEPRDLRLGAFQSEGGGRRMIDQTEPDAPLVRAKAVGFKEQDWHHIAFTWSNFDTGRNDAHAALYIDGKLIGELKDRSITMGWDIEKTGIYFAVGHIGLLDELAIFDRPLAADEISRLHQQPDLVAR